jgi:predicted enzyme related to lactoylglutathione lyase
MVERSGYTDGEPCWADVTAPDIEASKRFYTALLGWEYTETGPDFGDYVMAMKNGKLVAGMSPPQPGSEGMPPVWSLYLRTGDADVVAKRIEQLGGKLLVPPMAVGDTGRMVFALDPSEAAFGLWEAGQHRGAELFGEPGALTWSEVITRDSAAADAFYAGLFGYRAVQVGDGTEFDYVVYYLGDGMAAGRLKMTEQFEGIPPHWMIYFGTDDCDAAAQIAVANGGRVSVEPFDSSSGRIVVLSDPGGAAFSLIDPSKATAPPAS